MDRKKLDKLSAALADAWNSPQTEGDLRALARAAGRRERTGGKHVVWVTDHFPHRPFPIPTHGNSSVSLGVRKVILAALENDVAAWEDVLEAEQKQKAEDGGRNGA